MYLTIDMGNTRIKYACWDKQKQLLQQGIVQEIWELPVDMSEIEAIAVCNVRSVAFQRPDAFAGTVFEISGTGPLPFTLAYKTPETLGADRVASVAGLHALFTGQDALSVDAGTCIKFDLITADGVFQGGSISPGLQMRYKALNHYTGRLPEVIHRPFENLTGLSTEESILCGVQQGFIGEVKQRIRQFSEKYPELCIVLTGGDAPFLAESLKTKIFAEPLLIHHGLLHCLLNR